MSRVGEQDASGRKVTAIALDRLTAMEATWLREQAPLHAGDRMLWIGVSGCPEAAPPGALQASLMIDGQCGFDGDARGAIDALPFTDACASHLVLQHVLESLDDGSADALIQQCARLLKPSGVLALYGFHPHSLWRRQFAHAEVLEVRGPSHWRRALHALGFEVQRAQRIGAAWDGAPRLLDRFGVAYGMRAWRAGAAIIPFRASRHTAGRPALSIATRSASAPRRTAL